MCRVALVGARGGEVNTVGGSSGLDRPACGVRRETSTVLSNQLACRMRGRGAPFGAKNFESSLCHR
jgi:hypothetical protein